MRWPAQMRLLGLCLILLPLPALAQGRAQTLADIKAELSMLMADFNGLKAELVQSGAAASGAAGGDALQRLDAIEAELMRLTAKTEEVELKVTRVVTDGTNRVGDIEYRLCEVTTGCDVGTLGTTTMLGGDPAPADVPVVADTGGGVVVGDTGGGVEMAANEQKDFDRAQEVLATGDFRTAADLFATFAQSFPGGPLTQQALFQRGEALTQLGDTTNAARAYLDAFSGQPTGPYAADSLLKLGQGLGELGQVPDACVTLGEVDVRFPGTIQATNAAVSMQGLGCP